MAKTQSAASTPPKRIKVRVTAIGYYDHLLRHPGDVFVIDDEAAFSTRWMERVAATMPETRTSLNAVIKAAHDQVLASRMQVTEPDDRQQLPSDNPLGDD